MVQLARPRHAPRHRRPAGRNDDDRRTRKPWAVARRRLRNAVVVRLALVTRLSATATTDRDDPLAFRGMVPDERRGAGDLDRRRFGSLAVPAFSAPDSRRRRR